jgi:hypothetical protein
VDLLVRNELAGVIDPSPPSGQVPISSAQIPSTPEGADSAEVISEM